MQTAVTASIRVLALASTLLAATLFAAGCASTGGVRVAGAVDAKTAASFDRLKSLAGTWETVDEKGVKQVAAVFTVTSAGTAIREVMFPGQPHEMTNMYHLDGSSIIATHYCAMGNQPRMRCTAVDGNTYRFDFDGITNLPSRDVDPMGWLAIELKDADHAVESWDNLSRDGNHHVVIDLVRKR